MEGTVLQRLSTVVQKGIDFLKNVASKLKKEISDPKPNKEKLHKLRE